MVCGFVICITLLTTYKKNFETCDNPFKIESANNLDDIYSAERLVIIQNFSSLHLEMANLSTKSDCISEFTIENTFILGPN